MPACTTSPSWLVSSSHRWTVPVLLRRRDRQRVIVISSDIASPTNIGCRNSHVVELIATTASPKMPRLCMSPDAIAMPNDPWRMGRPKRVVLQYSSSQWIGCVSPDNALNCSRSAWVTTLGPAA